MAINPVDDLMSREFIVDILTLLHSESRILERELVIIIHWLYLWNTKYNRHLLLMIYDYELKS